MSGFAHFYVFMLCVFSVNPCEPLCSLWYIHTEYGTIPLYCSIAYLAYGSYAISMLELILVGALVAVGKVTTKTVVDGLFGLAGDVGDDWTSSLAERGYQQWRSGWFSERGTLNHDIAKALTRAFRHATKQIRDDWNTIFQHATTPETIAPLLNIADTPPPWLHHLSQQAKRSQLLNQLRRLHEEADKTAKEFLATETFDDRIHKSVHLSSIIKMKDLDTAEKEARNLFTTTLQKDFFPKLKQQPKLVEFICEQLYKEWMLRFREALKDPSEQGTRAWRAYQLLWHQSLSTAVETTQHNTEDIREVVLWLQNWAETLRTLPVTERDPTGDAALDRALQPLHESMQQVRDKLDALQHTVSNIDATTTHIDATTTRIEEKLDTWLVQTREESQPKHVTSHKSIEAPLFRLLPYQVDRKTQEHELAQAIRDHQQQYPHRPFVCIVHGDTKQCHDTFCEYLYEKFLKQVLYLADEQIVMEKRVSCPDSIQDFQQWSQQFVLNLSSEVSHYKHTSAEAINTSLALPVPVFIHTHITIKTFRPIWKETVLHYLRFWDSWPNTQSGQQLLLAFLFAQYKPFQEVKGWLERRQYQKQKHRFWDEVMNSNLTTINCSVLPSMENVTRDHVLDWSKLEDIRKNWNRRDWQACIHALFDKHKTDELPLDIVAKHLTELLKECQI